MFPKHLLVEYQEGFWLQVNKKSISKQAELSRKALAPIT